LWTDCCVHYIWNKHCISWSIDDSSERVRSVSVGKGLWQIHEILHPNRRSVPLWLCSVHLDGSDIHHLSLQSVQDVFPKVVPAFEEHVMIITVIVIVSIFFFVFWKLFFFNSMYSGKFSTWSKNIYDETLWRKSRRVCC